MTDPVTDIATAIDLGVTIDTDRGRLDLPFIHGFLSRTHWAAGIPFATMQRAIEQSIPFGLYKNGRQIGFARVVTDHATFAYLADVFVIEEERGKGYGRRLVAAAMAHPGLAGLRRWLLGTRDAAGLYKKLDFAEPPAGFSFLEKLDRSGYAPACAA
jgi:GNAT superfamily N-acetyltransferase